MRAHFSNAAYGVLDYAAYPIAMLVSAPILLKHLGVAQYGIWIVTTAALNTGAIIASGFGDANIQYIASARSQGDANILLRAVRSMFGINLLLRDKQGRTYQESKTFVIASQPPVVKVKLDRKQFHRGEAVNLHVSASDTTRTIVARMHGAAPVYLKWNAETGSNAGQLLVPATFAAGRYKVTVTAEDFAHNIGSGEVEIEILP